MANLGRELASVLQPILGNPLTPIQGGWGIYPIVAFGDSLTSSAGATGGQTYPVQAGALFSPPRTIASEGRGGQSAGSISTRQGGTPLTVTFTGNQIPARQDVTQSWDFSTGVQGWYVGGGPAPTLSTTSGTLNVTTSVAVSGARVDLAQPLIGRDKAFSIELDLVVPAGMTLRVTGITGGNYSARDTGSTRDGYNVTASGHYKFDFLVGNNGNQYNQVDAIVVYCNFGSSVTAGTYSIDNVVYTNPAIGYSVAVTAKSDNILFDGGTFTGSEAGTVAGVHGTLSTDASGNWTFIRDTQGGAVACPANSVFTLDKALTYRGYTQWLWAGNNGVSDSGTATTALGFIAAMAAYLPHKRYLVLGALPRATNPAAIAAFNAQLANVYGSRFVDLLPLLQAAGDGSANDNADIAAGLVPRSLRVDEIHLTNLGYGIVAAAAKQRTRAFGG